MRIRRGGRHVKFGWFRTGMHAPYTRRRRPRVPPGLVGSKKHVAKRHILGRFRPELRRGETLRGEIDPAESENDIKTLCWKKVRF